MDCDACLPGCQERLIHGHFNRLFAVFVFLFGGEEGARAGGSDAGFAVDDAGGDEDEQLGAVVGFEGVAEEVADDGDATEPGDGAHALGGVAGVDAADDGGVAVGDEHLGVGFFADDGGVTLGAEAGEVGFVLRDVDVEEDVAVFGRVGDDGEV